MDCYGYQLKQFLSDKSIWDDTIHIQEGEDIYVNGNKIDIDTDLDKIRCFDIV